MIRIYVYTYQDMDTVFPEGVPSGHPTADRTLGRLACRGVVRSVGVQVRPPDTSFMRAVIEVFGRLGETLGPLPLPVRAILMGGTAIHVYTAARVTTDVDAFFSRRVLVPGDLVVTWDDHGRRRLLTFDPNFFHALALLHPDAESDARPLGLEPSAGLSLWVLAPVDLAVSKLARWQDRDRRDVEMLAKARLIDALSLRARVDEALRYYVGDPRWLRLHLDDACATIEGA